MVILEKWKQMGPSPLRRSERGKKPDDGPTTNVKSTQVKTTDISKESAEDVNEDGNAKTHDPFGAEKERDSMLFGLRRCLNLIN